MEVEGAPTTSVGAQSADHVAVRDSALTQLVVTDDLLKAIDRLNKKHDPKRVLAAIRSWVRYMDAIEVIMARHAKETDTDG